MHLKGLIAETVGDDPTIDFPFVNLFCWPGFVCRVPNASLLSANLTHSQRVTSSSGCHRLASLSRSSSESASSGWRSSNFPGQFPRLFDSFSGLLIGSGGRISGDAWASHFPDSAARWIVCIRVGNRPGIGRWANACHLAALVALFRLKTIHEECENKERTRSGKLRSKISF